MRSLRDLAQGIGEFSRGAPKIKINLEDLDYSNVEPIKEVSYGARTTP